MKPLQRALRLCLYLASISFSGHLLANTSVNILVSIPPLQALVAGITQGVTQPGLLLDSSQSPHHASLRPSQMRAIQQADILFWIGPQLERFLPRVIAATGAETKSVALLANSKLQTLPLRHEHDAHPGEANQPAAIDPHIWLSPNNVAIMLDDITERLIMLDPTHAADYRHNRDAMQVRVKQLQQQLAGKFKAGERYLAYHDGYQYLEQALGLQLVASVSQNDELPPGAQHVHELRRVLEQTGIRCLVYEAPLRPALIDNLLQGTNAQAVEVDALGLRLPPAQRDWFRLMQHLADNFSTCLRPAKPADLN